MPNRTVMFTDRAAINFPPGVKNRIEAVAVERGLSPSNYMRGAVMERLKQDERGGAEPRSVEA